jgi:hypothetical protein
MPETMPSTERPMEMSQLMKFLHEVSDQVNSTLDLDELMVRIAQVVKREEESFLFLPSVFRKAAGPFRQPWPMQTS